MSDPINTPNPDSREPLIAVGSVTAGVIAILALVVAFGFNMEAKDCFVRAALPID